jgi:transcription initiation factor TFIIB
MRLQRALDKCPKCGKGPMVMDSAGGELVCSSCGFVVKEKIEETGPEWRAFSKEEKDDRSRGGIPTSIAMHDMGLATVIGGINKDASGKSLSAPMKATVERLRTWDSRSQVHEPMDRNLRQAFSELDRLSDKLSVSDSVIEQGDPEDAEGPCRCLQRQEEGHREVLQAPPEGDGHQDARRRPHQVRLQDSV